MAFYLFQEIEIYITIHKNVYYNMNKNRAVCYLK